MPPLIQLELYLFLWKLPFFVIKAKKKWFNGTQGINMDMVNYVWQISNISKVFQGVGLTQRQQKETNRNVQKGEKLFIFVFFVAERIKG